ncbi:MAG: site-specific integrase [Pseudomonadales bacterium]|nr:site-specific integrase [Pseudomonadales bacterium]
MKTKENHLKIYEAKGITLFARGNTIYARYGSPRGMTPNQQKISTKVRIDSANAIKTAMNVAEKHRAELIDRFNRGLLDGITYTLADVLSKYITHNTLCNQDIQCLTVITDYFGKGFVMNELCVSDIADYKANNIGRPHKARNYKLKNGSVKTTKNNKLVKPSTVRRELAKLSAAITYCKNKHEWDIPNPLTGNLPSEKSIKERQVHHHIASPSEWDRIKESAQAHTQAPHLYDFIILMTSTGWRPGAILKLKWSQVDLEQGTITPEDVSTSKKNNPAPINNSALLALKRRVAFCELNKPNSLWVFPSKKTEYTTSIKSVKKSFTTVMHNAGLGDKHITPHTLRHLVATRLRRHTSAGNTSKVLGHSNSLITEKVYDHLPNTDLVYEYEKLDDIFGNTSTESKD